MNKPTYEELESRLIELENLLASSDFIKDNLPDIIYVLDENGRVVDVNRAVEQYGYKTSDIMGRDIAEFIHPDDKSAAERRLKERRTGDRSTQDMEVKLFTAGGDEKVFETRDAVTAGLTFRINATGIYNPADNGAGSFTGTIGIARDITIRKKSEEEVTKLVSIVEYSREFIGISTLNGKVTYLNEEGLRISGLKNLQEALNTNIFEYVPEEDREWLKNTVMAELRDKGVWKGEGRLRNFRTEKSTDVEVSVFLLGNDAIATVMRDISEHKRNIEAVNKEKERAQNYLDIAGVMLVVIDKDQTVSMINNKGCEILGYEQKDIIGKNWFDHFLPKDIKKPVKEVFIQLVKGDIKPVEYFENTVLTKNNEQKIIAWHNTILRNENGEITGTLSSGEDVTERKKAEETLRFQEERLELALDATSDGLWDWNVQSGEVYFSPRYYTMLGYEPDELPSSYQTWEKLLHPDDKEHAVEKVQEHFESKNESFEVEFRLKTKSGDWKWILGRGKVVERDKDNNPVRMIGTHVDIHERKTAQEALLRSENSYRTLTENIPGLVYRLHLDGSNKMEFFNDMLKSLTGYESAELNKKGEVCNIEPLIVPEDRDNVVDIVKDALEKEMPFEVEYCIYEKGGDRRCLLERGRPIKGDDGKYLYIDGVIIDQTEKKRAQKELQDSETKYRTLVEKSPDVIMRFDRKYRHLFVSHSITEVVELDPDFFIGKTHKEIGFSEKESKFWENCIENVFKTGLPFETEFEFESNRGQVVFNWRLLPETGGDGKVESVLSFAKDITEQKRADDKIKEQNRFLNNIIESLSHPFYVIDVENYSIIRSNSATGISEDEHPVKCYSHTHRSDIPCTGKEHPCPLELVKKNKKAVAVEHIHIDKSGERKYFEIHGYPIFNDKGDVVQMIEYSLDITDRILALQAKAESESRYMALFENTSLGIGILNNAGEIIDSNLIFKKMFKTSGKDPSALNVFDTFGREARNDAKSLFKTLLEKKTDKIQIEQRIKTFENEVFWARITMLCIFDERSKPVFSVIIVEDITENKRKEEEEKQRQMQLVQTHKLAALGEVVAGVAHEINNPNSFISFNVPLLEETWKMFKPVLEEYSESHPDWNLNGIGFNELKDDMYSIIDSIRTGSDRINRIVTNLKDYSRTDETSFTKSVDVNEVVKKAMVIVGSQARKRVSKISMNLGDDLPIIEGHSQKLEQVVNNLILNASKAITDKSTGKLEITTRVIERLNSVLIEIEDNGCGIDPEILSRISEPFFTTRRRDGGTGLGLSVSHSLIKEHGGKMDVLSRPGVGSRFTVYLPLDRSKPLEIRPLILCVDDDDTVLSFLNTYFRKFENKFFESTSQPENVMDYIDDHPDVYIVLSDIRMPVMNGWELYGKIREKYPLINVILYSGDPGAFNEQKTQEIKPEFFLRKPFRLKELEDIINSIVKHQL
ncbi:PAS domain S-box protein [candidate division KSB1 bacterium]